MTASFQTKLWAFLVIHAGLFVYALYHWSWKLFVIGICLSRFCAVIGIEIALHRLWTHQSFQPKRFLEYILMCFAVPSLTGSSIAFAGVHRLHHMHSDTPKDPHQTNSVLKTILYIRPKNFKVLPRVVIDLARDPMHRFIHQNYFWLNGMVLILSLTLAGPVVTGYTLSFLAVWSFLEVGFVNVVAHLPQYGSRKYETQDQSANNRLVHFLAIGEGLHHNHHFMPKNYNFALEPGEVDLPAYVIRGFLVTGVAQTKNLS